MTAIDILRRAAHPLSAQLIAQHLGVEVEEVYRQLVAAEARGFARMTSAGAQDYHRRSWELGVNA